jgi:hypothetical protein
MSQNDYFREKVSKISKEKYERELIEKQRNHMENVNKTKNDNFIPCLHDSCSECIGTGIKKDGTPCIHMISCPCPKCKIRC